MSISDWSSDVCSSDLALFHHLALIAERQFGAVLAELLRDAPGERLVVGEPHDEPALSLHQSGHDAASSLCPAGPSSPSSGSSASAALRCAPLTRPSPTRSKTHKNRKSAVTGKRES